MKKYSSDERLDKHTRKEKINMKLSKDRILTTHVGSLPRSENVFKLVFAKAVSYTHLTLPTTPYV